MVNSQIGRKERKIKENDFKRKYLLNDVSKTGNNLMHFCSYKGWIVDIEKMIKDVDLSVRNHEGKTALELAIEKGHTNIIELIEKQIVNNNKFIEYAKKGNVEEMRKIMGEVNVNIKNEEGYAPIHLACLYCAPEFVEELIDNGAEINLKDEKGWTPLMLAANYGKLEQVKLLVSLGADLKVKDKFGNDALELVKDRMFNIGSVTQEELDPVIEFLESKIKN